MSSARANVAAGHFVAAWFAASNLDGQAPDLIEEMWFAEPGELDEAVRLYRDGAVESLLRADC